MERNDLLESYLRQLRLPSFARNYQAFAAGAACSNPDYTRYLLVLAEQEVGKWEQNRIQKRVQAACDHSLRRRGATR